MANTKNFIAKNGVSTGDGYAMPDVRPSLLLDFANSKTLDPRITFTRGSTATYWDGKTTTKAEENLFAKSEDFTNSTGGWILGNSATVAGNDATAPDGTTTADTLSLADDELSRIQHTATSLSAGEYTMSFYARVASGTHDIRFGLTASMGGTATVTTTWQRFTRTETISSSNITIRNGSGAGAKDIELWGLQIEARSSATAYTATTSSPIVKYQPTLQTAASGEARFDHDPVTGESKGLLIEEARTNLFIRSEEFDNSDWTKSGITVRANEGVAPDGTQTADALIVDSGADGYRQVYNPKASTTETRNYSVYFKSIGGWEKVWLFIGTAAGTAFNIVNGTVVSGTGTIEDVGNGWYRCSKSGVGNNTATYIFFDDGGGINLSTGNDYKGALVWGAQIEAGSFPTSYIPTSGSTVTRAREDAELPSSGWYDHSGTLFVDFNMAGDSTGTYGTVVQLVESTSIRWGFPTQNDANTVSSLSYVAPDLTNSTVGTLTYGSDTRIVMTSPDGTQFKTAFNGATAVTTSATAVPNPTAMYIGKVISDNNPYNGTFRKISYYPKRLSNATLQAMTEE